MSVALKNQNFTDWILLKWPSSPYLLAMDGLKTLQDIKYPYVIVNQKFDIGILSIDQPSWQVMLDFLQSDIAFRKSDRGEQEYIFQVPTPRGSKSALVC